MKIKKNERNTCTQAAYTPRNWKGKKCRGEVCVWKYLHCIHTKKGNIPEKRFPITAPPPHRSTFEEEAFLGSFHLLLNTTNIVPEFRQREHLPTIILFTRAHTHRGRF